MSAAAASRANCHAFTCHYSMGIPPSVFGVGIPVLAAGGCLKSIGLDVSERGTFPHRGSSPLLAGLSLMWTNHGRPGFADLRRRLLELGRISGRWCVLIVLFYPLVNLVTAGVALLTGFNTAHWRLLALTDCSNPEHYSSNWRSRSCFRQSKKSVFVDTGSISSRNAGVHS